ncbi:hypothetical protein NQ314_008518 [Rhamnusium bicolor]|uniref:HAT C-terminal dimerisation domain-containing protein n=1 Tax=Rhamnusium bicolor TaxID=1586634 RepID=A0AAV8YAK6_9CUCU|nr:hypothetical protein NQ314_008518 [Rhamnusium bicolor]
MKVNIVSGLFQHENADIFKIYCELYQLLLRNLQLVMKPIFLSDINDMTDVNFKKISDILDNELSYMSIDLIDFGYDYRQVIHKFHIPAEELYKIKLRCRDFVLTLCREIAQRIPVNIGMFNAIKYFSPEFSLKPMDRPKFEQLPLYLLNNTADKRLLDMQWNDLSSVKWHIDENTSSEYFWSNLVLNYKNAGGEQIFKDIAEFALLTLSLPLSNAVVERVFSLMNIIKTKTRNKINMPLLDALIRIKVHFLVEGLCCKNFLPTRRMHQKFNVKMYDQHSCKNNIEKEKEEDNTFDAVNVVFL